MKSIVIAGTSSGVGKTTVTLGLMGALKKRGLLVQPFKAGPDYIDPGHHRALLGVPSYNLDTWMMGPNGVRKTFRTKAKGADAAVIEGVMGLFDGRGGVTEEGSTAHLAKVLRTPVLLVVNAEKTARSVAAVVKGFSEFDPGLKLRWVLFNKVGSLNHYNILKDAVRSASRVKVLGYLPRDATLSMPSRHLGLVTQRDLKEGEWRGFIARAVKTVEKYVDVDSLLGTGKGKKSGKSPAAGMPGRQARRGGKRGVRIGVALDRAFCFYYEENFEILRGAGAELVFFSPLEDKVLPKGVTGLYFGGGYPELHSRSLGKNSSMMRSVKEAAASGMPVFAECGGLMYLSSAVLDQNGIKHPMVGVFPWGVRMLPRRRALGYREVVAASDNPFLTRDEPLRGHEYHYSEITGPKAGIPKVFGLRDASGTVGLKDGFLLKNTLAGYTHMHFASNPAFAKRFVEICSQRG
jgi:cobyrinic acid a,c-diamide synthase